MLLPAILSSVWKQPCSTTILVTCWCNKINKTQAFKRSSNNKIFTIFHFVDCQSSWVIYIIEFNICKLQYIAKSETGSNNHRILVKKIVNSCEVTELSEHTITELVRKGKQKQSGSLSHLLTEFEGRT